MGYSWVYMGEGTLPEAALEAWLSESTEGELVEGAESWGFEGQATVSETLDFLASDEVSDVRWDGGAIRVRVIADKSGDAWLTYRGDLANAFVLLGKHGGSGTLTVVGFDDGPEEGVRIEVRAGQPTNVVELDEEAVTRIRERDEYREIYALAEKAYGGLPGELE
jgi:hypothetical protein